MLNRLTNTPAGNFVELKVQLRQVLLNSMKNAQPFWTARLIFQVVSELISA
jgi:hypothetical protein